MAVLFVINFIVEIFRKVILNGKVLYLEKLFPLGNDIVFSWILLVIVEKSAFYKFFYCWDVL